MTNTNWKAVKLSEITDYINRGVPPVYTEDNSGTAVINQKCVRNGQVNFEFSRLTDESVRKVPQDKLIQPFDILINSTGTGTVGRVGQIIDLSQKTTVDSHVTIVRPKKEQVDPIFLGMWLKSRQVELEDLAEGSSNQVELSRDKISNVKVILPTFSAQQKIAIILTSIDEAIEKTNQIIQKAEILKQVVMRELLMRGIGNKDFKNTKLGKIPNEWTVVNLKDVTKITNGQIDPKKEPYSSMILIAPNHIESISGRILKKVSASEQHAISGKYLVDDGDVIYSKIRPYLKKVTIAEENCLCSADMYPMKGLENLDTKFLFHVLLSDDFTNYANNSSGRTGIPKINRDEIGRYAFALPPIREQKTIADILSSIDKEISVNQQIKVKSLLLKVGLMQDIFSQKVQIN